MASTEDGRSANRSYSGSGSGSSSSSSSNNRSSKNPQQQLTTIEKSVTHLLVATKQLLETLTNWSRGAATETEVSDVYVRLGYEFNIACRAFNAIGVETSDLGPVPEMLRKILEDTLSQEASQQSLDKYLPGIRDIIIKLLHGLKKKQQRLRQKTGSTSSSSSGGGGGAGGGAGAAESSNASRQASIVSSTSIDSNLTAQLEDVPSRTSSSRSFAQRTGSTDDSAMALPPRTSSSAQRNSPQRPVNTSPQHGGHRSRDTLQSQSSSIASNAMQNIPTIAPYPEDDNMLPNHYDHHEDRRAVPELDSEPRSTLNPSDALSALQRGGDLERRASRRFSAYQIQKHLGTSVGGLSAIPPPQHSPVPNRGRDVRESMSAVRSRRSVLHQRSRTHVDNNALENLPPAPPHEVRRISEEPSHSSNDAIPKNSASNDLQESPLVKTPPDKVAGYPFPTSHHAEQDSMGATLNGPMTEPFMPSESPYQEAGHDERETASGIITRQRSHPRDRIQTPPPPPTALIPDSSPQSGKELTLFLQYKSKIKKFVLSDGGDLTMARLQLGFIEKFAWNTHNNGVDLPEIYIQDPVSGVRHELEDLGDVKERSVLVLNVEALDEVKRHIDDGLGGLRRVVEGIRTTLDQQKSAIDLVSVQQQEAAKEVAELAVLRSSTPTPSTSQNGPTRRVSLKDKAGQLSEVQSLRRDLAVVRQTYKSFVSDINASMSTIRNKAASVRTTAAKVVVPEMDSGTGRAYVDTGKKTLSSDSEKIVNRVDDLQDTVEDLRKDVVTRGVRPLARQLENVSKDISAATTDLKKLQEYLKREKPIWTKIWEKELQVVCDDRDLLTMQEDLAADLQDDLEKAAATFALVEEATRQQNLQNARDPADTARIPSRTVLHPLAEDQGADPEKVRDGVLGEVRALQPNHESRLEAIERAERARQRELESRLEGAFKKELQSFKLKKSGGVDEVDRVRQMKDDQARRENHETKIRREIERREKREAEAAAAASSADTGGGDALEVDHGLDFQLQPSPEPEFVEALDHRVD